MARWVIASDSLQARQVLNVIRGDSQILGIADRLFGDVAFTESHTQIAYWRRFGPVDGSSIASAIMNAGALNTVNRLASVMESQKQKTNEQGLA